MPEGHANFVVKAPLQKVWDFLSDMKKVGTCIPGLVEMEAIDERSAFWTLKMKVGPISKTIKLKTQTVEQRPPTYGSFKGEGENITFEGSINLKSVSDKETEVDYKMSVNASGSLGEIINSVIRSKIDQQTQDFSRTVKSKLE